ncbi:MAG TPA: hypothetical protein VMH80_19660 [Bryobacteraceae bacterium]|nr:hypothetical protein [Bryobacteraceae bacterium]
MRQHGLFIGCVRVNIVDAEDKKKQFQRAGFSYVRELSPEEARLPDLKMHETVLAFSHPLN